MGEDVSLGVGDISQVLGCPMRPREAKVREVHANALETCRRKGVPAYALVSSVKQAMDWREKGVNTFIFGSDTSLFQKSLSQMVQGLRQDLV